MNPLDLLALTPFPCESPGSEFENRVVEATKTIGATWEEARRADLASDYHREETDA